MPSVSGEFIPSDPAVLVKMIEDAQGKELYFTLNFRAKEGEPVRFFLYVDDVKKNRVFMSASMKAGSRGGV